MIPARRTAVLGLAVIATLALGAGADDVEIQKRALRVGVWDSTEKTATPRPEVWLRGAGSWFPDIEYGSDARNFEGHEVGTTIEIFFYPLGRDEPEIKVEVPITEDLCPQGCVRDMVSLEIYDDRFEIWGGPVKSQTIPRVAR